jgi:vitamin B12 transporter
VYKDFFTGLSQKGESELDASSAHTSQVSPYASVVYKKTGFNVELGGRYNHHSQYGSNFTYTFNPSYLIHNKVKIFANASSAFKVPSLYQLYDAFAGNKDLAPEKSVTLEGGAEFYSSKNIRLRVTGFRRRAKNAIQYVILNPATFESGYRNVSSQKNYGMETEAAYQSEKWNVIMNYTFTRGKSTSRFTESGFGLSKDTTLNNLYRVPKHAANAFVFYNITPKLNVGTIIRYVGRRFEPVYAAAPKELDNYYTIDVSGSYNFNNKARLFADFKNITDQTYFDISGYNSRKFNMAAGIALTL